jgi:solute carrier family 50 protein (sugar transporter)
MIINCTAFLIYGIQLQNYYMCMSNLPGLVLGSFYYSTCVVALAQSKSESVLHRLKMMELFLIGGVAYFGIAGIYVGIILDQSDKSLGEAVFAVTGNILALVYYASPLTTIVEVVNKEDSSSLYAPTICANFLNAMLWTIYGYFGLRDPFVYAPNIIGATLAGFQLLLTLIYGRPNNVSKQLFEKN